MHVACGNGHFEVVCYLLKTGKFDPTALNYCQKMPLEVIPPDHSNRFDVLNEFLPFQQCRISFPIDTYTKVFLCGDIGAGKSSLAEVI